MKLRLRSLETKETLKIEVPSPCSLQHLKEVVSQRVNSSSSSAPASVHLSLNRRDELLGSSPQQSLQSLGITSGDLVFFTFNPDGFNCSSETLIVQSDSNSQNPKSTHTQNSRVTLTLEPDSQNERGLNQTVLSNTQNKETLIVQSSSKCQEPRSLLTQNPGETLTLEPNSENERTLDQTQKGKTLAFEYMKPKTRESNTGNEETPDSDSRKIETEGGEKQVPDFDDGETFGMSRTEDMDIDDDGSTVEAGKSFSVPCLLRKVFQKEVGEGGGGNHKLLMIAVHAVLLESGFVAFDSTSGMKVEGFHLPNERPLSKLTVSLWYTLPEIIDQGPSETVNEVETVELKFRSLGKYVNVYGSLAKNGSGIHRVCLDEDSLGFFLNIMWATNDPSSELNGKDSFSHLHPERAVFEFWKTVKDRLALPLLIDLCEKAGLAPPPCFMRLPTDLKLKILESLSGVDIAKVGCVCWELLYLSVNDNLWKQKFMEQFDNVEGSHGGSHWKEKFVKSWQTRKVRKIRTVSFRSSLVPQGPHIFAPRFLRDPDRFRGPRIIGGPYDLGPDRPRRNVIPHCFGFRHA